MDLMKSEGKLELWSLFCQKGHPPVKYPFFFLFLSCSTSENLENTESFCFSCKGNKVKWHLRKAPVSNAHI